MLKKPAIILFGTLVLFIVVNAVAQTLVLGGTIVTSDRVISHGWITVKDGRIESVSDQAPAATVPLNVETGGIIFPGFVDLHNHPMYNIFPRWQAGRKFSNRYEWRELQEYKDKVGNPGSALQVKDDQTFCDIDEYVEVRALIGGTTSITGISRHRNATQPVPSCVAGLIRNLDWASGFYGSSVGHERIENALGVMPRDLSDADGDRHLDEIASRKIDLLLVHVAEGSPDDIESRLEFLVFKGRGFLTDRTAIIHGTALRTGDFRQMRLAGTALIWSPRSNIELYGVTTDIAAAYREGVSIALAPDWSPTGSATVLDELRYAREFSRTHLFGLLSDRMLFEMATSIPARIGQIDDKVGAIEPGLYADLMVLQGDPSQPFSTLAQARTTDVQLVMVSGTPLYGIERLMSQFKVPTEVINVCGARMVLNSSALPVGKFADVEQRLKTDLNGYRSSLAQLAQCTP